MEVKKEGVGIFTVVAIVLAVLKITGLVKIGWGAIVGIWLIPLWILLGVLALSVVLYIIGRVMEEKK